MGCNEVEEYISNVLSELECQELKKTVRRILIPEINKLINQQNFYIPSEEDIANNLLIKLGDPKKLGYYFVWLKNIMDLH